LDVAVDDPVVVCGVEGNRCLLEPGERAGGRLGSVAAQPVLERPAAEVLHDDERAPLPLADVEDRDRARLAGKTGRGQGLALEALANVVVHGVALGEHLDRHLAPEQLIGGEVDVAHRSTSEARGRVIARRQQLGLDAHSQPVSPPRRAENGPILAKRAEKRCNVRYAQGVRPWRPAWIFRALGRPNRRWSAHSQQPSSPPSVSRDPRRRTRRRRPGRPSSSRAMAGATASAWPSTAPTATRCTAGPPRTSSPTTTR